MDMCYYGRLTGGKRELASLAKRAKIMHDDCMRKDDYDPINGKKTFKPTRANCYKIKKNKSLDKEY